MKKTILAIIAAVTCMSANAQVNTDEYISTPNMFVTIQGGAQGTISNGKTDNLRLSPIGALSVGVMANPYLGGRLNFTGVASKYGIDEEKWSFKQVVTDIDALFNITNVFRHNKYNPFNLYLLAGGGAIVSFDERNPLYDESYNARVGAIADYRLTRNLSANLEVNGNYGGGKKTEMFPDKKYKVNVLLGVAFRIGAVTDLRPSSKLSDYVTSAPVTTSSTYNTTDAVAEQAAAAEAAKAKAQEAARKAEAEEIARKAEVARKAEEAARAEAAKKAETAKKAEAAKNMAETIHFTIGKTNSAATFNDIVKATADWAKNNPEKTISVAGYADKGTGTAAVNERVAKNRAAAVVRALKKAGVPAKQINETSYGDTVQPFAENDMNRCVIIEGK